MEKTILEFKYGEYINNFIKKNNIKILCGVQSDAVKGITLSTGEIFINLSSPQWKFINEDMLIIEIAKTIIHEYIHATLYNDVLPEMGEEIVCQILANQRQDFIPNKKRYI